MGGVNQMLSSSSDGKRSATCLNGTVVGSWGMVRVNGRGGQSHECIVQFNVNDGRSDDQRTCEL